MARFGWKAFNYSLCYYMYKGGEPPADRTIIEDKLRIISRPLLYVMMTLSAIGVIFSLSAIFFNVCSLSYRLV